MTFRILFAVSIASFAAMRAWFHLRAGTWGETAKALQSKQMKGSFGGFGTYTLPWAFTCLVWTIEPQWLDFAAMPLPTALRWTGLLVVPACLYGLHRVNVALGHSFSGSVRIREDHRLVMEGPYRWVRHPMYAITNILVVAFGLVTANWLVMAVGLAFYTVTVLRRIPREEAMMLAAFGDQYPAYMTRTAALIPIRALRAHAARSGKSTT